MSTQLFLLQDKVAVITGGSRGIGRAIALGFAQAGAHVVLASRTTQDLKQVAQQIEGLGRQTLAVTADVSSSADVDQLVKSSLDTFDHIDILVNNAGISPIYKRAEKVTEEDWDQIIRVNLKGTFLCCQAFGRRMIERQQGNIINIVSIGAQVGLPRLIVYAATKGGVAQITKGLALEWARYNIRVNAIGPAFVETNLTKDIQQIPRLYDPLVEQTPMKRFARPEEMVGAAIYLASEASSYVTGQTIYVDGGWTAG